MPLVYSVGTQSQTWTTPDFALSMGLVFLPFFGTPAEAKSLFVARSAQEPIRRRGVSK